MGLALAAAAAADEAPGGEAARSDASVTRALTWLAANFDAETNTGAAAAFGSRRGGGRRSDAFWRHYWLWSIERAAAVTSATRIGVHDWYGAGCRVLLARQQDDGRWRDPERAVLATCFALLFFRKSTHQAITPRDRRRGPTTPSGDGGE